MRRFLAIVVSLAAALAGAATGVVQDQCGPFTDVSPALCPYVLEMYYLGITAGTSPTTYSPDATLTRGQAAVFVSKGVDQALARSSRRAALGQWWTTGQSAISLSTLVTAEFPAHPASDGERIWLPHAAGWVTAFRASDGATSLGWSGADGGYAVLAAMGRVFVTGFRSPGRLYMLDPSQPPGTVTTVAGDLGDTPAGIAFDGARLWTANSGGSISIVTPSGPVPWPVTTVATGFSSPHGIVFDGDNMWVTDHGAGALLKLDETGAILQSIPTGLLPGFPIFDGTNIWVPDTAAATVTVVKSATGAVVATLTGNGLDAPISAAFDGERVLVAGRGLSLWNAATLSPLGSVGLSGPIGLVGVCSDGINFWVTNLFQNQLIRF